jgi:hypothetical protein
MNTFVTLPILNHCNRYHSLWLFSLLLYFYNLMPIIAYLANMIEMFDVNSQRITFVLLPLRRRHRSLRIVDTRLHFTYSCERCAQCIETSVVAQYEQTTQKGKRSQIGRPVAALCYSSSDFVAQLLLF